MIPKKRVVFEFRETVAVATPRERLRVRSSEIVGLRPRSISQCCHAARDGECAWKDCPQTRDGEPAKSGRSCPLHWLEDDEE